MLSLFIPLVFGIDDALLIGLGSVVVGALGSWFGNRKSNKEARENAVYAREISSAMTGSELQQFQLEAAEAQKTRDWTKTQMLEGPSWEVQGYEKAGLNPALMYQQGVTFPAGGNMARADGTNASTPQTFGLDLSSVADLALKAQQIRNDYKLQNRALDLQERDISRKEKETDSVVELNLSKKDYQEIINKYADEAEQLKNDGQRAVNDLTRSEENKVKQDIEESKKRVDKLIEETENEKEKRKLIAAQTLLTKAQTDDIVELRPFKKALMAAQTSEAKAKAALASAEYLMKKGLIDGGYIEYTLTNMAAEAGINTENLRLKEFITELKLGHLFDHHEGESWIESAGTDAGNFVLGGLFRALTGIMDYIPALVSVGK